jgi:hypothetical protein
MENIERDELDELWDNANWDVLDDEILWEEAEW